MSVHLNSLIFYSEHNYNDPCKPDLIFAAQINTKQKQISSQIYVYTQRRPYISCLYVQAYQLLAI